MIKVEKLEAFNFDGAVRGMRNPMKSWFKSDSEWVVMDNFDREFIIGKEDLGLMKRLYNAGPEHAKYLRQIKVCMDITAPIFWWKEFDTYKIGTDANSTSTMHKIHDTEFCIADFTHEGVDSTGGKALVAFADMLSTLEELRVEYNKTGDKRYWRAIVELLPSSYNQMRTVTMSYANVMNILNQRENHKLWEWRAFCGCLKQLPYVKQIRGEI